MNKKEIQSSLILLLVASIWGLGFVAQRVAAQELGPFTYTGARFALGAISLLPLIIFRSKKQTASIDEPNKFSGSYDIFAGIASGIVMFIAVSFQQAGLVETEAGKAAFITGLYMIFVPFFGLFLKQKIYINSAIGAVLAMTGLYYLSLTGDMSISKGELLVLIGSVLWAIHILMLAHFTKKVETVKLSFIQIITCSLISTAFALVFETIRIEQIIAAAVPILYGGIFSVGVAYTLQILGQKHARPAHAAIVLSMEAVLGSIFGLIILKENLGPRGYLGCLLMFAGMLLSQFQIPMRKRPRQRTENKAKRTESRTMTDNIKTTC